MIDDSMVVRPVDYIVRLSPTTGEVLKEKAMDSLIEGAGARSIICVDTPEQGVVFVGYRHLEPLIAKISEDLEAVIWEKTPGVEGAILYEVAAMCNGSGYVAAGAADDSFSKGCIIGFDLEGNTIWSNVFAQSDSGKTYVRGIAALADGYLVSGVSRFEGDAADVYVAKTDLLGHVVYDTTYGRPDVADVAIDIDVAPNGGAYVAASTFETGQPDFYVIRTDPNGLQR